MIERVIRVARTFQEAAELDREDVAALSFEERISGVERLRKAWFGEDRAQPRLERVLVCADRPSRWRIDILTGIDGVTFDEAWQGRVEAEFIAEPLYVIGRAALIKNKRAAGRAKELSDVASLEAHGLQAKRRTPKRQPKRRRPAKRR
jgi:hypothetical protein